MNEDEVILCNDEVCEGDQAVDRLNTVMDKLLKLKQLLLLTDPSVSKFIVGKIQLTQWGEFCKCFPDEGEEGESFALELESETVDEEFKRLSDPLIKFINEQYNEKFCVQINCISAQVLKGEMGYEDKELKQHLGV